MAPPAWAWACAGAPDRASSSPAPDKMKDSAFKELGIETLPSDRLTRGGVLRVGTIGGGCDFCVTEASPARDGVSTMNARRGAEPAGRSNAVVRRENQGHERKSRDGSPLHRGAVGRRGPRRGWPVLRSRRRAGGVPESAAAARGEARPRRPQGGPGARQGPPERGALRPPRSGGERVERGDGARLDGHDRRCGRTVSGGPGAARAVRDLPGVPRWAY